MHIIKIIVSPHPLSHSGIIYNSKYVKNFTERSREGVSKEERNCTDGCLADFC